MDAKGPSEAREERLKQPAAVMAQKNRQERSDYFDEKRYSALHGLFSKETIFQSQNRLKGRGD